MHNKKNQFNTTFKNPSNQPTNDIHNKKHPNNNKSKYNNAVQAKNYHQNSGITNSNISNNSNNNNQMNMLNINNNINQINSPYIKKSHNPNPKNNQLEVI